MRLNLPTSLFKWQSVYGDDFGFEPSVLPSPVDFPPGSAEKLACLIQRARSGENLWHAWDKRESHPLMTSARLQTSSILGSADHGAAVGMDLKGKLHRYAIWSSMKSFQNKRMSMLYVPAFASFDDRFDSDAELIAIRRHATLLNATHLVVCPLFSQRCRREKDLDELDFPMNEVGTRLMRAFAKMADVAVLCFGDVERSERHRDVVWMLSRTIKRQRLFHVGDSYERRPPCVTRFSRSVLHRFDFESLLNESEVYSDDE